MLFDKSGHLFNSNRADGNQGRPIRRQPSGLEGAYLLERGARDLIDARRTGEWTRVGMSVGIDEARECAKRELRWMGDFVADGRHARSLCGGDLLLREIGAGHKPSEGRDCVLKADRSE